MRRQHAQLTKERELHEFALLRNKAARNEEISELRTKLETRNAALEQRLGGVRKALEQALRKPGLLGRGLKTVVVGLVDSLEQDEREERWAQLVEEDRVRRGLRRRG